MALRRLGSQQVRTAWSRVAASKFYAQSYATESKGPVYVVFGASGGIGSALCRRLVQQPGATVVAAARDSTKLGGFAAELGPSAAAFTVDAQSAQEVDNLMQHVATTYGKVDAVANCVGSIVLKPAHSTSEQEFEDTIRINLFTSFNILKSSVKRMMGSGGGSIVLCSSAVAKHGIPNHEAIAAAKAGVVGLALSAASTYAPRNIRVNCVAPGLTRTPLAAAITSRPASLKASEAMHALKRVGEPDEVAAALEFLMLPSNGFITGQVLAVDGGLGSLKPQ